MTRLAMQERISQAEQRALAIRDQVRAIHHQVLDAEETARVITIFNPVWESLTSREKSRVLELLIERADYDGSKKNVSIVGREVAMWDCSAEMARKTRPKLTDADDTWTPVPIPICKENSPDDADEWQPAPIPIRPALVLIPQ